MKKALSCFCAVLLGCAALVGCANNQQTTAKSDSAPEKSAAQTAEPKSPLPDGIFPMDLVFASGVGGWSSTLTLKQDGTFTGSYHDSEMGSTGDSYPGGTVYVCEFSGSFTDIKKVDDYNYTMKLDQVKSQKEANEEWIEDGVRYIASRPAGVEEGENFTLYFPQTPTEGLSEDFLSWWPKRFDLDNKPTTLSCYGLFNEKTGFGFFSEDK
ncbi:MAG: hypothetical protein ACLUO4_05290 [Christensenellales bacterium]